MARRTLVNIKERILKTVVRIGAEDGVENVTARKIAEKCDITDATVFVYYKTKENLLNTAYKYVCDWIFKEIDLFLENLSADKTSASGVWNDFFGSLVNNAEIMKYFYNFRYSGRNIPDVRISLIQMEACKRMVAERNLNCSPSENDYPVIWGNIIESIAYYAIQVSDGRLSNTLQKYELIKEFLFDRHRARSYK